MVDIKQFQQIIEEGERKVRDLVDQLEAAKKNIYFLENQSREHSQTIGQLQKELNSKDTEARRVIDEKVRQLRDLDSELHRVQSEKSRLENEL